MILCKVLEGQEIYLWNVVKKFFLSMSILLPNKFFLFVNFVGSSTRGWNIIWLAVVHSVKIKVVSNATFYPKNGVPQASVQVSILFLIYI